MQIDLQVIIMRQNYVYTHKLPKDTGRFPEEKRPALLNQIQYSDQ